MFDKFAKHVVHKVKDAATEEVKKSIEDSLPMYARLIVIGVVALMIFGPTKKVIPQAVTIVINNYY